MAVIGFIFGLLSGSPGLGIVLGVTFALIFGLFVAPVAALWYGGLDIVRHYCLRLVFCVTENIPARFDRIFYDCVGLTLLQKAGGGFRFPHEAFSDYFASLTTNSADAAKTAR
jgi:hypothetical protein